MALVLGRDDVVVRAQHLAHARAGDDPLIPLPLGHVQLCVDTVSLLPQIVHTAASGELTLFQQPND